MEYVIKYKNESGDAVVHKTSDMSTHTAARNHIIKNYGLDSIIEESKDISEGVTLLNE